MTPTIDDHRASRPGMSLLLCLGAGIGLVTVAADRAALADPPPVFDMASLSDWFDGRAPIDVAAGFIRIAVVAALAYLMLVALANLVASVSPGAHLQSLVQRRTPRLLGAVLAGSLLGATPTAGAAHSLALSGDLDPGAGATMEILDPADRAHRTQLPWADPAAEVETEAPAAPSPTPTGSVAMKRSSTHLVVAGDHLWGIAEQHLRSHGVDGSAALVQHWRALIDANQERLIDPDDPDLILPGQELLLPPLP